MILRGCKCSASTPHGEIILYTCNISHVVSGVHGVKQFVGCAQTRGNKKKEHASIYFIRYSARREEKGVRLAARTCISLEPGKSVV